MEFVEKNWGKEGRTERIGQGGLGRRVEGGEKNKGKGKKGLWSQVVRPGKGGLHGGGHIAGRVEEVSQERPTEGQMLSGGGRGWAKGMAGQVKRLL